MPNNNSAIQSISSSELQEAIIALIRQNNTELKQLLTDVLPTLITVVPKKQTIFVALPRLPYNELPFWKANPHLSAAKVEGYGISKEVFEEARAFFQDSSYLITDEWLEDLD